jgi:adenylate cyclase
MKFKFANFIFFIFFSTILSISSYSQGNPEKENKDLTSLKNDTSKVNHLIQLASNSSSEKALEYLMEAYTLSEELKYKKGLAISNKIIGNFYYFKGDFTNAFNFWNNSLKAFEEIGDDKGVANILGNIGAIFFDLADFSHASEYNLKALKIAEKIGDKQRMATVLSNLGNIYLDNFKDYNKALEYYKKGIVLSKEINDKFLLSQTYVLTGTAFMELNEFDSAMLQFQKADKLFEGEEDLFKAKNNLGIGELHFRMGNNNKAIVYMTEALEMAESNEYDVLLPIIYIELSKVYKASGNSKKAINFLEKSLVLSKELDIKHELTSAYNYLSLIYSDLEDYERAYEYHKLYAETRDLISNENISKQIQSFNMTYDLEKKQAQIDLLTKDNALQESALEKQKLVTASLLVGLGLVLLIVFMLIKNNQEKVRTNKLLTQRNFEISSQKEEILAQRDDLDRQKDEIETLILNILPAEVARELQKTGVATPRYYESASVLFTDFVSFSKMAEKISAQELVEELNACFIAFDEITERFGLEKIKTIGDSYMCASGLPIEDEMHALNAIRAAMAMQTYINQQNVIKLEKGQLPWTIRVGIHSGPVVAGVVGKKKFAYDIWGNTVNIASRMESGGEPDKVNISSTTYEIIKDKFKCSYRGKITAKNIGDVDMYFVEEEIVGNALLV